jgi:hypothetical protein
MTARLRQQLTKWLFVKTLAETRLPTMMWTIGCMGQPMESKRMPKLG